MISIRSTSARLNTTVLLIIGLLMANTVLAQTYEAGHQALQIWNAEGMSNTPIAVKVWVFFMLTTFVVGLAFVWKRVEARWAVGGFILGLVFTKLITSLLGLLPLSGLVALAHLIFWSPALYLLLTRRTFLKERSFYAFWCAWVSIVITISFVFDIRDAVIYIMHMISA